MAGTTITLDPVVKPALAAGKPEQVAWNDYFRMLQERADPERLARLIERFLTAEYEAALAAARERYQGAREGRMKLVDAYEAERLVRETQKGDRLSAARPPGRRPRAHPVTPRKRR